MTYFIGIDGGGTTTKTSISDASGIILKKYTSGALNANGQDSAQTELTLHDILGHLLDDGFPPAQCLGIGVGAAGITNPEVSQLITQTFSQQGFCVKPQLYGDHETALAAAFSDCHGIILIAGTGSICYGIDADGNQTRVGGYGHLIDDKGSGYDISRNILSAIVRSEDGRSDKTILKEFVYNQLSIHSIEEMIKFIYSPNRSKKDIAALSILLSEGVSAEDKTAIEIEKQCVKDLKELLLTVMHKMPDEKNIALAGSILTKNERIKDALCKELTKHDSNLNISSDENDASEGAIRLIMKNENKISN